MKMMLNCAIFLISILLECNAKIYDKRDPHIITIDKSKKLTTSQKSKAAPPFQMAKDLTDKPPKFTYTTVHDTENSATAQVSFDAKYKTIYLLNYEKDIKGEINESQLYITRNMGLTVETVDILYRGKIMLIARLFASEGIVVAFDRINKTAATSTNLGKTWTTSPFWYQMKDIMIHPTITNYLATINIYDQLSISIDTGVKWPLRASAVKDFVWSKNSSYMYYTKKTFIGDQYALFKEDANTLYQAKEILQDVVSLKSNSYIVYATARINNTLQLFISHNDGDFIMAMFPYYVKAQKFIVKDALRQEIFVTVVNGTDESSGVHLYSALITDLKFSRISDDIGMFFSSNKQVCTDLESFRGLPGVLITQKKLQGTNNEYYTAVSYSHGNKWGHIISPRMVDGFSCQWPNCRLMLELECDSYYDKSPIMSPRNSPNLMIAHGYLYNPPQESKDALYISTDAGYSWIRALPNLHDFTILNDGNAIITFPEYSYEAFYSYTLGLTWSYHNISSQKFRALEVFHNEDGDHMISSTIGYNEETNSWVFVVADFTDALTTDCKITDYDQFTPGATKKNQCFQGLKNGLYKRKHGVTCKSIINNLPEIKPISCPCTADDFGCAFGYYVDGEQCLFDPDMLPDDQLSCKPGEFLLRKTNIDKIHGDSCKNTGKFKDEEAEICNYSDDQTSATILAANTLKYIIIDWSKKYILTKLPINIRSKDLITSFCVDHRGKCIYYLNGTGIIRSCWATRDDALGGKETYFLKKSNIRDIKFEEFGRNLYYSTDSEINVYTVDTMYTKNIVTSTTDIIYFNILPQNFFMAYATTVVGKDKSKVYQAVFNFLHGDRIQTANFSDPIISITYIPEQKMAVVFTEKNRFDFSIYNFEFVKKSLDHQNILEAEIRSDLSIFITTEYIAINDTKIIHSHINDGTIYNSNDKTMNPCLISPCQYFCFPVKENSYKCGCPEDMVLGSSGDCVCEEDHPSCKACQSHEFHCDSGKCIDIIGRCNGVDDCGDNSDEVGCIYMCTNDEFLCGDNLTCVNVVARCDGVSDCPDGLDEKGCPPTSFCKSEEFTCINKFCIPWSKYCDGVNDCGDFSDEDSCQEKNCKSYEVKCADGQCILPTQVCDGKFDCADWSDEKGCEGKESNHTDPKCAIKCDTDKCIPLEKICDHITDCEDGIDEIECLHSFNCPNGAYKKCVTDTSCYPIQSDCDGFEYCNDGSDELTCRDTFDKCNLLDNFQCYTKDKCIEINRVCDGVYDCDDRSDEGKNCLNFARVVSLEIKKMTENSLEIEWDYTKIAKPSTYNVTLQEWNHLESTVSIITPETSLIINNLQPCKQFTLTVKTGESQGGRSIQFVSKPSTYNAPTKLKYTSDSVLSWDLDHVECMAPKYFVACYNGNAMSYKNFTDEKKIAIPFNSNYLCKVSACPMNVFNLGCGEFSTSVRLSDATSSQQFVKIGLPIIFVVAVLAGSIYGLIRLKQKGKLYLITNLFKKSADFRRLPETAVSSEQTQLFDETQEDLDAEV